MNTENKLSKNLKALLSFSNRTILEMSIFLGISDSTFRKFLYGDTKNPRYSSIYILSRYLWTTPYQLMFKDAYWTDPENQESNCTRLLNAINSGSPASILHPDIESEASHFTDNIKKIIQYSKEHFSESNIIPMISSALNLKSSSGLSLLFNNKRQPTVDTACNIAYSIASSFEDDETCIEEYINTIMTEAFDETEIINACDIFEAYSISKKINKIEDGLPFLLDTNDNRLEKINNMILDKTGDSITLRQELFEIEDISTKEYYSFLLKFLDEKDYLSLPKDFFDEGTEGYLHLVLYSEIGDINKYNTDNKYHLQNCLIYRLSGLNFSGISSLSNKTEIDTLLAQISGLVKPECFTEYEKLQSKILSLFKNIS